MKLGEELNPLEQKIFTKIIRNSDKIKIIGLALHRDQVLMEHKTSLPTTLLVLKGQLQFALKTETFNLNEHETFEIPINEMHQVKGLADKNTFLLIQEKA